MAVQCAIELGPRGITSNVIAPGPIAGTEGVDRLYKDGVHAGASKAIPSGRLGRTKDIADATVYLFSDAGNYVNGATLVGKYTILRLFSALRLLIVANFYKLMEEHGVRTARVPPTMYLIPTSSSPMKLPLVPSQSARQSCRRPLVLHAMYMPWNTSYLGLNSLCLKVCRPAFR